MVLRDEQWERLAPLLPGKVGDPGQSAADNRLFLEAVLWVARVGAPWRDLPESFGKWNSVFQRFRRWARRGVFEQIFTVLSEDADFEYVILDGTIVRVHQHGTGARGGGDPESGHRTVSRWPDDEDRRLGRCPWQLAAVRAAARPKARQRRCRSLAQGHRLRSPARRQSVR